MQPLQLAAAAPAARPVGSDRLIDRDSGIVALLILIAAAFYLLPWAPLYLPALVALGVLTWLRLDLALVLVPLFAPYYMLPKHLGSEEFAPSEILVLLDVTVAVAYVLLGRVEARACWIRLRASGFVWPAALLLAAGAISTALAADRHEALRAYREVILEPTLFFALLAFARSRRTVWLLVLSIVAAACVVGGIGLGQLLTHQNLTAVPGTSFERIRSVYGSPDNVGLLYARAVPLWFAIAVLVPARSAVRRLWSALGFVLLPVLLLTWSRGAWLAVLVGCLFVLTLVVPWGRWIAVACILAAAAALLLGGQSAIQAFRSGHANTVQRRLDLWEASLRMIRDHPVVGVGPDNFLHYYAPTRTQDLYQHLCTPGLGYMNAGAGSEPCLSHPHNEVLDFWLSTGIAGLVAFFWLQLTFWRAALRRWTDPGWRRERALVLGAMAAMLAALIHGLVDNSYFLPDLAVVFWILCAAVSLAPRAEPAPEVRVER